MCSKYIYNEGGKGRHLVSFRDSIVEILSGIDT